MLSQPIGRFRIIKIVQLFVCSRVFINSGICIFRRRKVTRLKRTPKKPYLIIISTFLFLLFTGIASAQVTPDTAAKVDEYMNAGVKYARYNGAVLVAATGKPVIAKGYGMANFEDET